jgi:uncharacterized protein YcfL
MGTLVHMTRIVALLACASLIAACSSAGRKGDGEPRVVEASTELPGDPKVERDLEVVQPRVGQSGRTKTLEFELRNRSSERMSFAYTVVWSDRSDKRVGVPQRTWTLLTLEAGASVPLMISFPADGAESWRLLAVRPEEVR